MRRTRVLLLGLVVAVLGYGHSALADDPPAVAEAAAPALPSAASRAAETLLRGLTAGPLTIARDADGLAHQLATTPGAPVPRPDGVPAQAPPARLALAHLQRAGALFGLDAADALRRIPTPAAVLDSAGGNRIVRFRQLDRGLPVIGGALVVSLDRLGNLLSISGETTPGGGPDAAAGAFSRAEARQTALTAIAKVHEVEPATLSATRPTRWRFDPELIGARPLRSGAPSTPVWRVQVADGWTVRELVLIDARTGRVTFHVNQLDLADDRVCDQNFRIDPTVDDTGAPCAGNYVRTRSSGPSEIADAEDAFANAEATASFYSRAARLDLVRLIGIDRGDGMALRSTVNYCAGGEDEADTVNTEGVDQVACTVFNNAFWNGTEMYFGPGWPDAEDVVGHELTHGVIDKTSRLLYFYQSGAINESMADVFGEFLDRDDTTGGELDADWVFGESAPLKIVPLRSLAAPTLLGSPDRMTSQFYNADSGFADNGGVHTNSGVGNKAAYLIAAGGQFNGQDVAGLGEAKAAQIYYRTLRTLTSGADYADLGRVLPQACRDLVGTAGISRGDCTSVDRAVAATEMERQPPVAKAPEVGFCPTGGYRRMYATGFEGGVPAGWDLGPRGSNWFLIDDYATQGTNSIFGVEPDSDFARQATLRRDFVIPRGVATYLRFSHQYRLERSASGTSYDGARVEYSTDRGRTWHSASSWRWANGPTAVVTPNGRGTGYRAFGGDSHGYVSSRVEIPRDLRGSDVRFRWSVIGDSTIAYDGWTLDTVRLFACGGPRYSNRSAASIGNPCRGSGVVPAGYLAVVGDRRDNRLVGSGRPEIIIGGSGDDRIRAGGGADIVCAGRGDDAVSGGAGADRIYGGSGNDRLLGRAGDDLLLGQAGRDRLAGGPGDDRIGGGGGNDLLLGRAGDDLLLGQAGRDRLGGGSGDDRIGGGGGNDLLVGGPGRDRLVGGPGRDVVRR